MDTVLAEIDTRSISNNAIGFAIASTYAALESTLVEYLYFRDDSKTSVPVVEQDAQAILLGAYIVGRMVVSANTFTEVKSLSTLHYSGKIKTFRGTYGKGSQWHMAVVARDTRNSIFRMVLEPWKVNNVLVRRYQPRQALAMAIAIEWADAQEKKEVTRQILPKWNVGNVHEIAHELSDFAELQSLKELKKDWDGYGADAPNKAALATARNVLNYLKDMDLKLERVLASAVGGVSICFVSAGKYAEIECYNTDTAIAITSLTRTNERSIWEVDSIKDTLQRISRFIQDTTEK
ncbi:hypothetical protein AYO43_09745 [Nitrospira sp. SCGC AG-212-E16]|nr:hypothetical protein AYO43_09745 [Nitrospira sp. SCGC AG-212-E16]